MDSLAPATPKLEDLLLDPNNYRFQDDDDFVLAEESRFHEESVQERAYNRLRPEGLKQLKESILTNGFLPFEQLVVIPYSAEEGKYLVIEGNRRLAALRWIARDNEAGVDIPQQILETLQGIPVTVIQEAEADQALRLALMGIRHVGGIREWGAYQRAKLVTQLRDVHELDTAEVATRLGMTSHEVNRRYRAFKALAQMEQDEEYADQAEPDMYPLFHEAVAGSTIKEWLGWNDNTFQFDNEATLHEFYGLITPTEAEDGTTTPPRLPDREAVRELRTILESPDAKKTFLGGSTIHDALALAKAEELSGRWLAQVAEAHKTLQKVSAVELENLEPEELQAVESLREAADHLLELHAKLTA